MSHAEVLSRLGERKVPSIFDKLFRKGVTDLMNVMGETNTPDDGGGFIKTETVIYENVPVTFEAEDIETYGVQGGKLLSVQQYKLTCSMYFNNARLNITPAHRIKILRRSGAYEAEPDKVYSIVSPRNISGVYWEIICKDEN